MSNCNINERYKKQRENGTLLQEIAQISNAGDELSIVDFSVAPNDTWQTTYNILLTDIAPSERDVVILFPNHPDEGKKQLSVKEYKKINSVNLELNQRYKNSMEGTALYGDARLIIVCGNMAYKIMGISGNIYLLWAETMNTIEYRSNMTKNLADNQPILVCMDGSLNITGMFWLQANTKDDSDLDTLLLNKVHITRQLNYFPWILESDCQKLAFPTIRTISRRNAIKHIKEPETQNTTPSMLTSFNPFQTHRGGEEEEEEEDYGDDDEDESSTDFLAVNTPSTLLIREDQQEYTPFDNGNKYVLGHLNGFSKNHQLPENPASMDNELDSYPDIGTYRPSNMKKDNNNNADVNGVTIHHITNNIIVNSSMESEDTQPIDDDPFVSSGEEEEEEEKIK